MGKRYWSVLLAIGGSSVVDRASMKFDQMTKLIPFKKT